MSLAFAPCLLSGSPLDWLNGLLPTVCPHKFTLSRRTSKAGCKPVLRRQGAARPRAGWKGQPDDWTTRGRDHPPWFASGGRGHPFKAIDPEFMETI